MGRQFYSQVSGIAHGESAAVGMFIVAQPGRVVFQIPREQAVAYAGILNLTCVKVIDRMVTIFGLEPELATRWGNVKKRAGVAISEMQRTFP